MQMVWIIDIPTQIAARNYPLPIHAPNPLQQDQGVDDFHPDSWVPWLRPGDAFLPWPSPKPSPSRIIAEFHTQHHLQALALTACWGRMGRTQKYIYRQHSHQHIYDALDQCAESISLTHSIQQSWSLLTGELKWTSVITSKVLHFLCRALGFNDDPPVPIDGGVILKYVWPGFRIGILPGQRPADWEGNTFDAYCRYMTAILTWSHMKQPPWTTTDIEATIYDENY